MCASHFRINIFYMDMLCENVVYSGSVEHMRKDWTSNYDLRRKF